MRNITQLTTAVVHTHNGAPATNSLVIADRFNKRHTHVLRAIQQLECSPKFTETNFGLSEYVDESGKKNKYFIITRDGFMFLAMGFTGKEAALWKEKFINAFNELEKLQQPTTPSLNGTRWCIQFGEDVRRHYITPIQDGALLQTCEELIENIKRADGANSMFKPEFVQRLAMACITRLSKEASKWEMEYERLSRRRLAS